MEEWKEYKLGEVTKRVKVGFVGSCEYAYCEPSDNAIPMIRTTNLSSYGLDSSSLKYVTREFHEKNKKSQLHYGDILIARHGENGKASRYNKHDEANCLNVVIIEPDEEKVPSHFIKYLFDTPYVKSDIRASVVGSVQNVVNTKTIANLIVKIPNRIIQNKIISILKSLDDKIEVNRKINENLEQQAQALFKSWFVDFEPFKNGEFVESELGMIPKGWRVYTMEELVDRVGGYSYKGNELQESTTAMATIKNFERNGGFKINGFKEIVPSSKAKHEQFLKKFDVIIAHTDLTQNADIIGNPALILHFGKYDRLIMSMDLVKVKSKSDYITYGLLYCFFSDARFKSHALGYVNGTTVLHLSKKAIPDYKLALPNDLSILAKFGKTFDSIFAKEAEMMEETDRLATLRDTLLPKLMSGELKVNEIA